MKINSVFGVYMDIESLLKNFPDIKNNSVVEYNPMECFYDRVREKEITHSDIIADLLNPNGNHGMGDIFLKSFLKKINIEDIYDNSTLNVYREYQVERILTEGLGKRSIDIVILWENEKKAIIIENKLNNAKSQNLQIEDYKRGLKKKSYDVIETVCLQGSIPLDIGAGKNLKPSELAEVWNVKPRIRNLDAYITLLKNMDKINESKKLAKEILEKGDSVIKKVKCLSDAYGQIRSACFDKIVDDIKKNKEWGFGDGGEFCEDRTNGYLNLYHKGNYASGSNKGYRIVVDLCNNDTFEVWIKKDDCSDNDLDLDDYVISDEYPNYYRAKEGLKRYKFPSEEKFHELVDYLCKLLEKLYNLRETVNE